jgi:hypothetical protein
MKTWHYLTIRLFLWTAAVVAAVMPITMHEHVDLSWDASLTTHAFSAMSLALIVLSLFEH